MKLRNLLNEGKLLASSPTEERIIKLISQYFMGSTISLHPTDDENIFDVHNLKGKLKNFHVVKKGGKYRFEEK